MPGTDGVGRRTRSGGARKRRRQSGRGAFLGLVLVLLAATSAMAATVALPRTGERTIYGDWTFDPSTVKLSGDDLAMHSGIVWPEPRFTDLRDGTIRDNLTGLIWLQDASCFDVSNWTTALSAIAGFNNGSQPRNCQGYNAARTWRMPNVNEILSLVVNNSETRVEDWLMDQGFKDVPHLATYLTSTTAESPTKAFVVTLGGYFWPFVKSQSSYRPWPVSAGQAGAADENYPANVPVTGQSASHASGDDGDLRKGVTWPAQRFVDHGNGTVTDNLTGLMWLKDASCMGKPTWQAALERIEIANRDPNATVPFNACTDYTASYKDWRMPNLVEQRSLFDYSNIQPALQTGHPFVGVMTALPAQFYWTSTSNPSYYDGWAWIAFPYNGQVIHRAKSFDAWVWPVRGGGQDYRFLIAADSRSAEEPVAPPDDAFNAAALGTTLAHVKELSPPPVFGVFIGDMAYGETTGANIEAELGQWKTFVNAAMADEVPNFVNRIYPLFGRHERNTPLETSYPRHWTAFTNLFDPVANGTLGSSACQYFDTAKYGNTVYYCDYGGDRFFMLNNDCSAQAGTGTGCLPNRVSKSQRNWVAPKLTGKRHYFVFHHEPAFGTGAHGREKPSAMDLQSTLRDDYVEVVASKATMIFSGHEHQYARRRVNSYLTADYLMGNDYNDYTWELKTGTCGAPVYKCFDKCCSPDEEDCATNHDQVAVCTTRCRKFLDNVEVIERRNHYAVADVYGKYVSVQVFATTDDQAKVLIDEVLHGTLDTFKDPDSDGVPSFAEGPGYSANTRTAQFASGTGVGPVRVEVNQGNLRNAHSIPPTHESLPDFPAGFEFPFGVVRMDIAGLTPGAAVNVKFRFPQSVPQDFKFHKYLESNDEWVEVPWTQAGDDVQLTLIDGGAGDGDGEADGKIRDPGAFGFLPEVLNPHVIFSQREGGQYESGSPDCPAGYMGKYSYGVRIEPAGSDPLRFLLLEVIHLTGGNLLLNGDRGPGIVGSRLTVPTIDDFADGALTTGEYIDVPIELCLATLNRYRFLMDVKGLREHRASGSRTTDRLQETDDDDLKEVARW